MGLIDWKTTPKKFQKQIGEVFKEYTIPKITIKNDCISTEKQFKLSLAQGFLTKYMTPENPNGLLIYASVGSGKTLTSISILKNFESLGFNMLFITRTTLKNDIDKAIKQLPLKRTLPRFSYKQFSNICHRKGENYRILMEKAKKLNPKTNDPFYKTLIVIDEAHKLYTKDLKPQEMHNIKLIQKMIHESYQESGNNRLRLVLMSATPITEDPMELINLFNLLIVRPSKRFDISHFQEDYLTQEGKMTENGKIEFNYRTKGIISYINLSNDPSKFARTSVTNVWVPISEHPNYLITKEKDCREIKKDCLSLFERGSKQAKVYCQVKYNECLEKIKKNKKFIKNSKFQEDYLKSKCNIEIN
jgi:superfamily II DNA or RNA helicase